jgi:general secretion pathway protein A
MYEKYWELRQKPFESSSDPAFYYPSDTHQGALLKIRYAVEGSSGGALLTGAPGLGKSLLIQSLLRNLPNQVTPRVNLVFPRMPADQLLAYIADELDGRDEANRAPTIDASVRRLQKVAYDSIAQHRVALIVVDEAHLLDDEDTLDTLRLLLNFEYQGKPGLRLVLVGQPSLLPILDRYPGIEERLAVKCLLRPFSPEETAGYIQHRLQQAGGDPSVFEPSAIDSIHAISHGVPRKINRLCDLALLIAFAEQYRSIDAPQIEAVSEELITVVPE